MKTNNLLAVSLLAVLLAACSATAKIAPEQNFVVVTPPETFYTCPTGGLPESVEALSNRQVAETIVTLHKNNLVCKTNMNKIQSYITEAKNIYSKKQ